MSQRFRILVADDQPVNRSVLLLQLGHLGHAAEAVEGGREALAALEEKPYDALLLDCQMPGFDGFETCRELRRREGEGRRMPVIAVTGHGLEEDRERCLAAGMDDVLIKPFGSVELAAMLGRWLREEVIAAEPPRAAPPAEGELDARLAALRRLGGETGASLLAEATGSFLAESRRLLATFRSALRRGDAETFVVAAHTLAGTSGVLGAVALARQAQEIETLARQGDLDGCAVRLPALEQAFREVEAKLSL
ncbi:MAG TPA: response regulator [Thermoanaerobaculia bacterium]